MNNYTVYIHVNKYNGKKYVGITSGNPVRRWQNGRGYFRNKHFTDAINRYGWDGFYHLIICSELTKQMACQMERDLISKYHTTDKMKGYNITTGGEHFVHSEESKRLMSERRKGKGKDKRSHETRMKIKEHHAGGTEKRPVFCIETEKRYSCINDAARETGINKKGISGCCRQVKHYNTAGGYHWRFASCEG